MATPSSSCTSYETLNVLESGIRASLGGVNSNQVSLKTTVEVLVSISKTVSPVAGLNILIKADILGRLI